MKTTTKHVVVGLVLLVALIVAMVIVKVPPASAPAADDTVSDQQTQEPVAKMPAGTEPSAQISSIMGSKWVWIKTMMSDDAIKMPSRLGAFTVTFSADGHVSGTTDCNGFGGDYSVGTEGVMSFGPFVSTQMYCEKSQESLFTKDLSNVSRMMIDQSGNLVLMLKYDSGSMIFQRQ